MDKLTKRLLLARVSKRDAKARTQTKNLRHGRPERIDRTGLPCERCHTITAADDLVLMFGDYMLCSTCAKLYAGIEHQAKETNYA